MPTLRFTHSWQGGPREAYFHKGEWDEYPGGENLMSSLHELDQGATCPQPRWVCVQLTQPFWVHFLTCQMRHMQIHWHGWDAEETGFKPREVPLAPLKGLAKGLGGILGEGSCFRPAPTGEPSVWAAMGASVPGTEQGAWGLRQRLGAQSLQETTQSRNLSPLHSLNEVIQRRKPNQPMFYAWSGLASSSRSPREVLF